jgi:hypothetical protein
VGAVEAERVEEPGDVPGHVEERVGSAEREAQERAHHHAPDVRDAARVELAGEADVAVVERDDAEAAGGEELDEAAGPGDELHADARDEDQRFAVAVLFVRDVEAVEMCDGHGARCRTEHAGGKRDHSPTRTGAERLSGGPFQGGTCALRNFRAMQSPVAVPAKGSFSTSV